MNYEFYLGNLYDNGVQQNNVLLIKVNDMYVKVSTLNSKLASFNFWCYLHGFKKSEDISEMIVPKNLVDETSLVRVCPCMDREISGRGI